MALPLCPDCSSEVIPALLDDKYNDACYCPKCRTWTKKVVYPGNAAIVG